MPDDIKTITLADEAYPPLLKEIAKPPEIIYYRGALPAAVAHMFAVVGTRKPTYYGTQITPELAEGLAANGLTIVSGLATGIDALAHVAALKSDAQTIAALGSGVDDASFFPQENLELMHKIIASGGCVLSEFPPGTPARKEHFPQRNRIISGLALGTLVIEAPTRSGALITARFALEQNREVFAVPGPITSPYSWGPNFLIKQGAHAVLKVQDILEVLGIEPHRAPLQNTPEPPDGHAKKTGDPIESFLSSHPTDIDDIIRKTNQPAAAVVARLTALEIQGKAKHVGGGRYVKI